MTASPTRASERLRLLAEDKVTRISAALLASVYVLTGAAWFTTRGVTALVTGEDAVCWPLAPGCEAIRAHLSPRLAGALVVTFMALGAASAFSFLERRARRGRILYILAGTLGLGIYALDYRLRLLDPARVFNVTFAVTAPVGALPGSAPHLSLRLGNCERGFATGQTVFMAVRYCGHPADIATVVLTALDDSNVVVASTAQAAVTLIEDSVGTTAVTFASPWVTSTTGTTTVTNVPTVGVFTNSNPLAQVGSSTGSGIDLVTIIDFRGSPADLSNNEYMGSFSRLLPGAAFTQNEFDLVETPRDGEGTVLGLVTRALVTRGAIAATTTLDFSTPLPAISSTAVAGGATPTVTWTSKAPLTGTKAIETFFTWFTGNNVGTWLVYAPPTATSIAPPSLPAALVAFGPTA